MNSSHRNQKIEPRVSEETIAKAIVTAGALLFSGLIIGLVIVLLTR